MSDADDIAELLQKAVHDLARQKRLGWIKGVGVLVAAFAGAGWTAHGYLSQLVTKDDLTSLERQYTRVQEDEQAHERLQDDRMSRLEPVCAESAQCCVRAQDRLDKITTPRAFAR